MRPEEFLKQLIPAAQACQHTHGIPASFTLAQAILESGWGSSLLAREVRNLFGVKADRSWRGPVHTMETKEYVKGKPVMVQARWRAYRTWEECLEDRAAFFVKNQRYARCFQEKTGEGWAYAAAAAGYATDPDYAKKLINIMRKRNLSQYDQGGKL